MKIYHYLARVFAALFRLRRDRDSATTKSNPGAVDKAMAEKIVQDARKHRALYDDESGET